MSFHVEIGEQYINRPFIILCLALLDEAVRRKTLL